MRFSHLLLLVTFVFSLAVSCGYRVEVVGDSSFLLGQATLTVGKIKNLTRFRTAGIVLAEKIKDALVESGFGGSFSEGGSYIIRGQVVEMTEKPVGFSQERFGLEYEVSCRVYLEVVERETGKGVLVLDNLFDTSTYYSGNNPSYTRTNREKALEAVMERISKRFVNLVREL
jgi:hypothetical protein